MKSQLLTHAISFSYEGEEVSVPHLYYISPELENVKNLLTISIDILVWNRLRENHQISLQLP